MNQNLYPTMMTCDGTCKKRHPLEKVIRDWVKSTILPALTVAYHYCFPCYEEKFFGDEEDDTEL